jgi:hypothetical protein
MFPSSVQFDLHKPSTYIVCARHGIPISLLSLCKLDWPDNDSIMGRNMSTFVPLSNICSSCVRRSVFTHYIIWHNRKAPLKVYIYIYYWLCPSGIRFALLLSHWQHTTLQVERHIASPDAFVCEYLLTYICCFDQPRGYLSTPVPQNWPNATVPEVIAIQIALDTY